MNTATQRGMTLIELVVAIVVIAVAVFSVITALSSQASRSADAMIRAQSTHIADAYLDEVLQKAFQDPNGLDAPGRINFDDVSDYDGYTDNGVHDQTGAPVTGNGLDQFTISIAVTLTTLNGIPAKLVNVTVAHGSNITVIASGYRTLY